MVLEASPPDQELQEYVSPEGASVIGVRSILITSSQQMLKARGHFERYVEALPELHREQVLQLMGPTWVPIRVAAAHYQAWEGLGLSDHEIEDLASGVSNRLSDTFLATVMRSSRNVGATPWILLNHFGRVWSRVFQGGYVNLHLRGPKEVALEARGLPMFDGRAFPIAYRRVISTGLGLFARRLFVRPLPIKQRHAHAVLVSWV